MPWLSVGIAALGVLTKERRSTEKAFTPRNCVNCGAPDEGYTNCRYCTTRMRMGAEEAIERLHVAKASVVDESQPEWSKGLRESMVTAMLFPELVNAIQTGEPTPLSDAFSSGGGGDFSGGGASGEF